MANIKIIDAGGLDKFVKSDGAGTDGDPFVLLRRNFNQKSSATLSSAITVGSTSVIAKTANTDRRFLSISVKTNDVFIKLQTAATDNNLKGITIAAGQTYEMPVGAIYTGEVSAIRDAAGDATIYVTEY